MSRVRVLMCGSDLEHVKGGMVSVSKNYLSSGAWKETELSYITTHVEKGMPPKLWVFGKAYIRILLLLLHGNVDVALLNVSERGSFFRKAMIMKLCHRFFVPVIFHHHGAEFNDFYASQPEKRKRYIGKTLAEADLNLLLSKRQEEDILSKSPEAKVDYLYNSVGVKQENPYGEKNTCIVTIGRLGQRKGTYDLLEALRQIDGLLPEEVKAAFCGDGDVEQIKERVEEYGLSHRVVHIGWVENDAKKEWIQKAMMHILPSYREVLPMSILETMAEGIPNISTKIASIPEVIEDGENGFLIEPGDVQALKQSILTLAGDEALRRRFSRNSHEKIRTEFSLEHNIAKLEMIFLRLAHGRRCN